MKGTSALAELFSVTVGFREHRFALTKDLSKFSNCVLVDELAQHTRRIVWGDGDESEAPKVFVTTTVNFGDHPAGCIAMAAVRETVEMFGQDKLEAKWFLQKRTYVDDCMAGDNNNEKLLQISTWLDEVVKEGGFKFQDTHMSRDDLEDGIPRKVFGILWDTHDDRLSLDIKINFAGKRKGAKLAPDIDPEEEDIDEATMEVVTKRMVWRVAQAQ
jgi:hypothetical protein